MTSERVVPSELLEMLPNDLPRVSQYGEFLRITKQEDSSDMFVIWITAAYTLMSDCSGHA